MPQRIVLVYQAGTANVFEVEQFTLEAGSKRKRLLQHAFEPCRWFAHGMAAAGATVMTAACNKAGDIANQDWTGDLDSQPFADKLHVVGEVLTQSMPGRTPEQVDALFTPGQVYCVTLTVAANNDQAGFNGDVQRVLFVDLANDGKMPNWFGSNVTDQKDGTDNVFELELWYDPSEQAGWENIERRLLEGQNLGEVLRQHTLDHVNAALGTVAPIFRVLSVDGPDFQNDPRDPFEDDDTPHVGELGEAGA